MQSETVLHKCDPFLFIFARPKYLLTHTPKLINFTLFLPSLSYITLQNPPKTIDIIVGVLLRDACVICTTYCSSISMKLK